jgi:hypothetical protein
MTFPALGGSSRNVGVLFPKDGEQSSGNERKKILTSGTDPGEEAGRRVGTPYEMRKQSHDPEAMSFLFIGAMSVLVNVTMVDRRPTRSPVRSDHSLPS